MKTVSLILPSFRRAELLDFGLWSLSKQSITCSLEIVVVNDGIIDTTENICKEYSNIFSIRYIFSGQRNIKDAIISRVPATAINIGAREATGDIIILSCPEIFHLNNTIDLIVNALNTKDDVAVPEIMGFDDNKVLLEYLFMNKTLIIPDTIKEKIVYGDKGKEASEMPFLMGMFKNLFIDIGGYDLDFNAGYAGDDSEFVNRLKNNKIKFNRVPAEIIHLWHMESNANPCMHWENPKWVVNWNLFLSKKNQLIANKGINWKELK